MKSLKLLTVIYLAIFVFSAMYFDEKTDQPALKDIFKKNFLIGAALNTAVVTDKDPKAAAIVVKHYNTITSENAMKWERIHPELNEYNFEAADRFVDFGQKNKMFIIGHTLVWQHQTPDWAFEDESKKLLSRDAMLERMKEHIFTVVGHYKGKVNGWDVVNEAFDDDGKFHKTKWLETIGEDFIAKAFEYTHQADPNAELYYNDFSCEKPGKRDAIVHCVRELKSKGLRIDGVGIQGHWSMDFPIKEDLDVFIDSTAAYGVKVMVTELDIDILPRTFDYMGADISLKADLQKELNPYTDGLPDSIQQRLANRYAELFSQLIAHQGAISRVTFWGVYDKTSWLNNWPVRGRTSYPLLFDRNYQPKPAFFAVVKTAEVKK